MSNTLIAAEKAAAFREAAREVGDGDATAYLIEGPSNPQTPWDNGYYGEPTEYRATAMQKQLSLAKIEGSLIMAGDILLDIVEPEAIPTTAMRVRWKDKIYRIVTVMPLSFMGDISYEVQARV